MLLGRKEEPFRERVSVCGDWGEKDRGKRTVVNSLADYRERQLDGQRGQQITDFSGSYMAQLYFLLMHSINTPIPYNQSCLS